MKTSSEIWRQLIRRHSDKMKIVYIDLIEEFRALFPEQVHSMFIGREVLDYYGAAGHYTEEGNAYTARILYKKLLLTPEMSDKLRLRAEAKSTL